MTARNPGAGLPDIPLAGMSRQRKRQIDPRWQRQGDRYYDTRDELPFVTELEIGWVMSGRRWPNQTTYAMVRDHFTDAKPPPIRHS